MEENNNIPAQSSSLPSDNPVKPPDSLPKEESKSKLPTISVGIALILFVIVVVSLYFLIYSKQQVVNRPKSNLAPSIAQQEKSIISPRIEQVNDFEKSKIVYEKDIPSTVPSKLIVYKTDKNIEGFESGLYLTNGNYDSGSAKKFDVVLESNADFETFISSSKLNPYIVLNSSLGDKQEFYLLNSEGALISNGIVKNNYKTIGYGTKFGCMCGTYFKAWVDDSHFSLKIVNGNGEEYEILVDASNGKVNKSSLKRTK